MVAGLGAGGHIQRQVSPGQDCGVATGCDLGAVQREVSSGLDAQVGAYGHLPCVFCAGLAREAGCADGGLVARSGGNGVEGNIAASCDRCRPTRADLPGGIHEVCVCVDDQLLTAATVVSLLLLLWESITMKSIASRAHWISTRGIFDAEISANPACAEVASRVCRTQRARKTGAQSCFIPRSPQTETSPTRCPEDGRLRRIR